MNRLPARTRGRRRQRGVSMLLALIGLLLMMLSAVAMVRSFGTSSVLAGNLAFRRDLTNQGERGIAAAAQLLRSGVLAAEAARERDHLPDASYSAVRLPANASGIPLVLVNDTQFAAVGLKPEHDIVDADDAVTIRYVIDRQCSAPGAFDPTRCTAVGSSLVGTTDKLRKPDGDVRPVYRVTVRVDGPRATQAFLQATYAY